jgi:hypothetical protein
MNPTELLCRASLISRRRSVLNRESYPTDCLNRKNMIPSGLCHHFPGRPHQSLTDLRPHTRNHHPRPMIWRAKIPAISLAGVAFSNGRSHSSIKFRTLFRRQPRLFGKIKGFYRPFETSNFAAPLTFSAKSTDTSTHYRSSIHLRIGFAGDLFQPSYVCPDRFRLFECKIDQAGARLCPTL